MLGGLLLGGFLLLGVLLDLIGVDDLVGVWILDLDDVLFPLRQSAAGHCSCCLRCGLTARAALGAGGLLLAGHGTADGVRRRRVRGSGGGGRRGSGRAGEGLSLGGQRAVDVLLGRWSAWGRLVRWLVEMLGRRSGLWVEALCGGSEGLYASGGGGLMGHEHVLRSGGVGVELLRDVGAGHLSPEAKRSVPLIAWREVRANLMVGSKHWLLHRSGVESGYVHGNLGVGLLIRA